MKKINAVTAIASSLILAVSSLVSFVAMPLRVAAASTLPAYRFTNTPIQSSGYLANSHVTTDATGNVYVTGVFGGTVNFAGSLGNDTFSSVANDFFVTKYNANNTYGWTKVFDIDAHNGYAQANGMATDAAGNIYLAGNFSGGVIFDGQGGTDLMQSSGNGSGAFLTEYTPDGTYVGTKTIIAQFNHSVNTYGLSIDTSGRVVLAGNFDGSVDFNPGAGTDTHTDIGGNGDIFFSSYNADGSYGWTSTFDTTAGGSVGNAGVATDAAGNIFVAGSLYGTVDFDPGSGIENHSDGGNGTSFITKLTSNGSYVWTRVLVTDPNGYTYPTSVSVDPTGSVFMSGSFGGSVNFNGSGGTDTQTDVQGSGDGYVAKYGSDGNYDWTKILDTSPGGNGYMVSVANDINGDTYVLSAFNGSINFAGAGGSDIENQPNSGALTMYNPDGSYAWTRAFDTTNGTAVTTQGTMGAVTADRLGNIYIASQFTGTVLYDGPGGTDSRTTAIQNGFLTSYRTFVPRATIVTAASVTQPGAQLVNSGIQIATVSLLSAITLASGIFVRRWRPNRL